MQLQVSNLLKLYGKFALEGNTNGTTEKTV